MMEIIIFMLKVLGVLVLGFFCLFVAFCIGCFIVSVVQLIREGGGK